jgi:hypothetical protein
MLNYSESDFCTVEDGLDYIFAVMGAIYGAGFKRHWEGMDLNIVRKVWADQVGKFLTYKPSMDYAIKRCSPDFPPSAIKFRDFCNSGPQIPAKPIDTFLIERKMTIHEQIESQRIKAEALAKLSQLKKQYGERT